MTSSQLLKSLSFGAVLLLLHERSLADWTLLTRSVEATISYDKASIKKSTAGVKLWTLTNFASVEVMNGHSYRSAKGQFEFDCPGERYRVVATIYYEMSNGAGKVIESTSLVEQWNPVAPKTMANILLDVACAKKKEA